MSCTEAADPFCHATSCNAINIRALSNLPAEVILFSIGKSLLPCVSVPRVVTVMVVVAGDWKASGKGSYTDLRRVTYPLE